MEKGIVFKEGRDYNNVYFMVVDAKGHSKIVQLNDSDRVDRAFDLFEEVVHGAADEMARRRRCELAEFWGWQGDGGLCVFYDKEESFARETVISTAKEILSEIPHLNYRLYRDDVSGEIHVRIAVHKGSFRFKGEARRGSIHSKELNLTSHVEKVVPSDTLAMSKKIYDISGQLQKEFYEAKGTFENMKWYLYSKRPVSEILDEWKWNLVGPVRNLCLKGTKQNWEQGTRLLRETKNMIRIIGAGPNIHWLESEKKDKELGVVSYLKALQARKDIQIRRIEDIDEAPIKWLEFLLEHFKDDIGENSRFQIKYPEKEKFLRGIVEVVIVDETEADLAIFTDPYFGEAETVKGKRIEEKNETGDVFWYFRDKTSVKTLKELFDRLWKLTHPIITTIKTPDDLQKVIDNLKKKRKRRLRGKLDEYDLSDLEKMRDSEISDETQVPDRELIEWYRKVREKEEMGTSTSS